MKNNRILLIGGGGHCKSVLDSLLQNKYYSEIGIIDKQENIGKSMLDIPYIGCDDDLVELHKKGYDNAFVAVGSIGDTSLRIKLYNIIEKIGFYIPNIIDPSATISKFADLKSGIFIGKNVIINAGSSIGKGTIINSGSIVEHDCNIGKFSHIAPGAVLCGEVLIDECAHIGANSVIKQHVKVGMHAIVGIGSVVLHDVKDYMIVYGNPCREGNLNSTRKIL